MAEAITPSTAGVTSPNPANLKASGTILAVKPGSVTFRPAGTNYQLELAIAENGATAGTRMRCDVRVTARKVYTVPSGGNFISPIFGPPKVVQGLVRWADERWLVVHAGCPIHVELPPDDHAIDLDNGPVQVGRMVNVVCLPGAQLLNAER